MLSYTSAPSRRIAVAFAIWLASVGYGLFAAIRAAPLRRRALLVRRARRLRRNGASEGPGSAARRTKRVA